MEYFSYFGHIKLADLENPKILDYTYPKPLTSEDLRSIKVFEYIYAKASNKLDEQTFFLVKKHSEKTIGFASFFIYLINFIMIFLFFFLIKNRNKSGEIILNILRKIVSIILKIHKSV